MRCSRACLEAVENIIERKNDGTEARGRKSRSKARSRAAPRGHGMAQPRTPGRPTHRPTARGEQAEGTANDGDRFVKFGSKQRRKINFASLYFTKAM